MNQIRIGIFAFNSVFLICPFKLHDQFRSLGIVRNAEVAVPFGNFEQILQRICFLSEAKLGAENKKH
jgi:hypothetical protein